jgi:ketosteroid isomerase-like protein
VARESRQGGTAKVRKTLSTDAGRRALGLQCFTGDPVLIEIMGFPGPIVFRDACRVMADAFDQGATGSKFKRPAKQDGSSMSDRSEKGCEQMLRSTRDAKNSQQEIEVAQQNIVQATNSKDSAALMKLLSPDVLINSPANKVIGRSEMIEVTLDGEMEYAQYENVREGFSLFGSDIAVIMGKEIFVHADPAYGEKEVVRRYTDVWQRIGDDWMQIARQATYTPEDHKGS